MRVYLLPRYAMRLRSQISERFSSERRRRLLSLGPYLQYFSYFIGFCRLSAFSTICKRAARRPARFRPHSIFARGHGDASEEIAKPDDVDSVLIGNSVHQIPIN
jgi:hypothetical protein